VAHPRLPLTLIGCWLIVLVSIPAPATAADPPFVLVDEAEARGVRFLEDLRVPPGNRLEALGGDREGQYSVRVNDQYRICFKWSADGPERVEIADYH